MTRERAGGFVRPFKGDRRGVAAAAVPAAEQAWLARLALYRAPSQVRSAFELAVTFVPFIALWGLCWWAVASGLWFGLVLTPPAAAFLVRLFMIQHDCGHGSFFADRRIDDWVGRVLAVLTLTPYDYWRRVHSAHHASSGNLNERGMGDITTLTVREYQALSRGGRLQYRLYRNPLVMFGLGPIWLFMIKQRLPVGVIRSGGRPWVSVMATNLAIVLVSAVIVWAGGLRPFLMVQLPIIFIAGAAGVWLFYVQHQFEDTEWAGGEEWTFSHAALRGSSYYDLPPVLNWLSANIGIHHVHHLASRIPHYRLSEVLRDYPELRSIGRVTLLDSFRGVKLVLWDESCHKLVSFRDAGSRGIAS